MPELSPMGRAALELSEEYGFAVFPVEPRGKRPLISGGFRAAATHPEPIIAWWGRWPNANIGLYPGASQLLVIDVDGPEGDDVLRAAGAFADATLEVRTRRGFHRYFRLSPGVMVGNLARSQFDIRAHAGYVLAPPSVHPSAHVYAWCGDRSQIADISTVLLERLLIERASARATAKGDPPRPLKSSLDARTEARVVGYVDRIGYGLEDGRKTSAYRLSAFLLFDVGLADDVAFHCVAEWNRLNLPPLSAQRLSKILANAARYARGCV